MTKTQLIKLALEKFFYKIRVNVALNNVLKSGRHDAIAQMFTVAIKKQLSIFTTTNTINNIVGVYKNQTQLVDSPEIFDGVMRYWIPIIDVIEQDEFNDYLAYSATAGGQAALDKLKVNETFQLKDESSLKDINLRVNESLALIDQTSQLWAVKVIRDSLKEGSSPEEIAKTFKAAINKMANNRGDLIAEHEAALALGEMEMEVYRRSGIQFIKWVTARDELVCEICMGNEEAGAIEVGTIFPNGVSTTPAHHRCRCLILPVTQDEIKTVWNGQ